MNQLRRTTRVGPELIGGSRRSYGGSGAAAKAVSPRPACPEARAAGLCQYGCGEPALSARPRDRPALRKALGQHHLRNGGLCLPLIEFLAPAGHRVIEIGPGGGVLTRELMAAGAVVAAVELDPEWAFRLRGQLLEPAPGIAVADALDLAWERLSEPVLVAGNLPYQIGTALLERLLARARVVPRAAFLLQREVVERIVARPGGRDYGALSVLVAARAQARLLSVLRPGAFVPPPKVESAFVGLELGRPEVPRDRFPAFAGVVRLAFSRRRKTLRNALASAWGRPGAEEALEALGWGARTRAEELDLPAFQALLQTAEALSLCPLGTPATEPALDPASNPASDPASDPGSDPDVRM